MDKIGWLVAGFAAFILILQALDNRSLREDDLQRKKDGAPTQEQGDQNGSNASRAIITPPEDGYADQKEKTRRDRRVEAVGFFTLLVVFAYTFVSCQQWVTAHDTLIATSRAWVDVTYDTSSVSFDWDNPNGPAIGITLIGENKGNSPALHVTIFPHLVVIPFGAQNIAKTFRESCGYKSTSFGSLVFVKEKVLNQTGTSFSWREANDYRKQASIVDKIPFDKVRWVNFYLVTCGAYFLIGDTAVHITVRAYDVGKIVQGNAGPIFVSLSMKDNLPAGQVTLRRQFEGDYAD